MCTVYWMRSGILNSAKYWDLDWERKFGYKLGVSCDLNGFVPMHKLQCTMNPRIRFDSNPRTRSDTIPRIRCRIYK